MNSRKKYADKTRKQLQGNNYNKNMINDGAIEIMDCSVV